MFMQQCFSVAMVVSVMLISSSPCFDQSKRYRICHQTCQQWSSLGDLFLFKTDFSMSSHQTISIWSYYQFSLESNLQMTKICYQYFLSQRVSVICKFKYDLEFNICLLQIEKMFLFALVQLLWIMIFSVLYFK